MRSTPSHALGYEIMSPGVPSESGLWFHVPSVPSGWSFQEVSQSVTQIATVCKGDAECLYPRNMTQCLPLVALWPF